ncbi:MULTISPECIES: HD domain-containing protein [Leuconostoc]|uniref:HD domain protein n=2 Tax=Leuconostoc kimchii TaxID=136609 RepID=D5T3S3_LEUKI|nr:MULTISPECIES: HD domain-containing protein [Leuconostoc]ADG40922.1 HD domain protein [Leuconostoc kimchii IMSNU 11154]AEJ31104.1 HD domain protein [Leuconostoc sp. C2]QBR48193.1 HD domain-containing protein [Leuconostoc kimchii]
MQNPNAWRHDQDYLNIVDDLLQHDEVQQLAQYTQHHFSNRLRHSISVSYQSYIIAKKIGADATATARAGLLHDLFYYDWRVTKFEEGSHAYVHPRIALRNAKKITPISQKEADIILKHMFGATIALPKYRESWIVSIVDDFAAVNEYLVPKAYLTYFKWHTMWVKKVAEVFA